MSLKHYEEISIYTFRNLEERIISRRVSSRATVLDGNVIVLIKWELPGVDEKYRPKTFAETQILQVHFGQSTIDWTCSADGL